MKNVLIIGIIICVAVAASAQSRKDIKNAGIKKEVEWKYDYTNGKEEKVKDSETVYDEHGNKIEIFKYDKMGKLKEREKRVYNDENDEIEITEYKASGAVDKVIKFKYNDNKKVIEEDYYKPDGVLYKTIKFDWDGDFKTAKYVYDENKKLKSKQVYQFLK